MHWFTGQFLPRAVAVLKKHNVLKYAVQKMDSQVGAAFQAEAGQVRPGWKVNDCDLVLEYWVKDLESLKSLASDPEWIQTALEPGNDWFDMSGPTIRIGYDTTYLEHGEIVNVAGRKRRSRVTASFD
ncbi:putative oxygenase like protein [Verticillium longisporum]|nr:putative oxygenase like protein [Verticillium longisporum]